MARRDPQLKRSQPNKGENSSLLSNSLKKQLESTKVDEEEHDGQSIISPANISCKSPDFIDYQTSRDSTYRNTNKGDANQFKLTLKWL